LQSPNLHDISYTTRVLVISISTPNSSHLTTFNAWLRRAFLFCKLVAPLFVSVLTSLASYPTAASTLLVMSLISLAGELWWIGVVWHSWACLEEAEVERRRIKEEVGLDFESGEGLEDGILSSHGQTARVRPLEGFVRETIRDMMEFAQMPVFLSEFNFDYTVCGAWSHRFAYSPHQPGSVAM
jgi:iron-regulated transporter 1